MDDEFSWHVIDRMFQDNPSWLVDHHLQSYNHFIEKDIPATFAAKGKIELTDERHLTPGLSSGKYNIYLGGKEKKGLDITFHSPTAFPNTARIQDATYALKLTYKVEAEYVDASNQVFPLKVGNSEQTLAFLPVMLGSDQCLLNGLPRLARFEMGECKNDSGGYFIIDGLEKCIIPQEGFADNVLMLTNKLTDTYSHSVKIRSVSTNAAKRPRNLSVHVVANVTPAQGQKDATTGKQAPGLTEYSNNQVVVRVSNVEGDIPLFILMRALGVLSDKEIISYCLLDQDLDNIAAGTDDAYVNFFAPSVHDAGMVFDQPTAIRFIKQYMRAETVDCQVLEILADFVLPHVGEMNFREKALFLVHMVKQLLRLYRG